jgi:hypothetical protein
MAQWMTTLWPGDRAASERAHRTVDQGLDRRTVLMMSDTLRVKILLKREWMRPAATYRPRQSSPETAARRMSAAQAHGGDCTVTLLQHPVDGLAPTDEVALRTLRDVRN